MITYTIKWGAYMFYILNTIPDDEIEMKTSKNKYNDCEYNMF